MKTIIPLDNALQNNINLVGGKAASLGELLSTNIPVPPGFVITTEAYKLGMTGALKKEILEAFNHLGEQRVAVRSSAVAEDSFTASWAGQLESYLNVTRDNLIDAISNCWMSMKSERAMDYANTHKVDEEQRAVAVIVQKMVDSDISGVVFTANPINKSSGEYVIEALYGLGELLVQGAVTPETSIVDAVSGKILHRENHRQNTMLVYKNSHNTLLPIEDTKIGQIILNTKKLSQLHKTATRIDHYFRKPQDIEWAFEDGQLYVLQSRPITTL